MAPFQWHRGAHRAKSCSPQPQMAWKQAVAHLEPNTNPHVLIEPIFDFLSGWAVNDLINVLGPASQSPYCPRIPNCQTVNLINN